MAWTGRGERQRCRYQSLSSRDRKRGIRRALRRARDIDEAVAIHGNRRRGLRTAAAEVGGELEQRIDHQLAAAIIRSHFEADTVGGAEGKSTLDRLLMISDVLIDTRLLQTNSTFALIADENQITFREFEFGRTI